MSSCRRRSIPRSGCAQSDSCARIAPSTPRPPKPLQQEGVGAESLRRWVVQADIDAGDRDGQTSEEHAEIRRLKAENRKLRDDVAILKAATTFFVGELDPRNR